MGDLREEDMMGYVTDKLNDSCPKVRFAAIEALSTYAPGGHQTVMSKLAAPLVTDCDTDVCNMAKLAVARIADESVRGPEGGPLP